MAAKRKLKPEFDKVSSLNLSSPSAKLQGVVTSISPMKKSSNSGTEYFFGELADDTGRVRIFGFDSSIRDKLQVFHDHQESVEIKNCQVKPNRENTGPELFIGKKAKLEKSSKLFDVGKVPVGSKDSEDVCLGDIKELDEYLRVTVAAKVLSVAEAEEIGRYRKKQDVTIADTTGVCRLTVWEENIGTLVESKSYRLTGVMVRRYNRSTYLTTAKTGSQIEEVDDVDIGENMQACLDSCKQHQPTVTIIGVETLQSFNGCLKCGSRVIKVEEFEESDTDDEYAECTHCEMLQKLGETKSVLYAQFTVAETSPSKERRSLRCFGKVLHEVAGTTQVTKRGLLKANKFSITSESDGVIRSICRYN